MIIERDGKFFQQIRKGSVTDEPDGRHYRDETIEQEISEIEFLRIKIQLLEAEIADLKNQPKTISVSYPTCPCSCPCSKNNAPQLPDPWREGQPLWYVDPNLQPTYTCSTRSL